MEMEGSAAVPVGYRFEPTEKELLQYLFHYTMGLPLPCKEIKTEDLYGEKEPWEIFGDHPEEGTAVKYFYSTLKRKRAAGARFEREVGKPAETTGDGDDDGSTTRKKKRMKSSRGQWHGQDSAQPVMDDGNGGGAAAVMGFKRSFVYKREKSDQNGRWLLKEYFLNEVFPEFAGKKDFVLCRLKKKTKK
ncbi:unnamed protein product [Cuscuta epithymum]|uniref:NAC domain-containing protein n=1 Tax=Cuscuta epithymum TaxID=186058 RepID=A0AAV0FG24_9ASTE|nr:unnamed protein product [Cuscuta epithymum]